MHLALPHTACWSCPRRPVSFSALAYVKTKNPERTVTDSKGLWVLPNVKDASRPHSLWIAPDLSPAAGLLWFPMRSVLGLMTRKRDGPGLIITKTRPPEPWGDSLGSCKSPERWASSEAMALSADKMNPILSHAVYQHFLLFQRKLLFWFSWGWIY